MPDATLLRPERLLDQGELTLDAGAAGLFSQTTKTPTGALLAEHYDEVTLRLRGGVGITRFLRAEVVLPLLDVQQSTSDDLASVRFGEPTVGLAAGGRIRTAAEGELHLGPLAELTFPVSHAVVLRPRSMTLLPSDRGIVVSTGGISAVLGALIAWRWQSAADAGLELSVSGRGFYRVRSANASDGAGFDLRLQALLFGRCIVGAGTSMLYAFGGLEQATISPSRASDSASWLDASVLLGYRLGRGLDAVVAFSAPVWVGAAAYGLSAQVLLSWALSPYADAPATQAANVSREH
jgi:hypothetical protein